MKTESPAMNELRAAMWRFYRGNYDPRTDQRERDADRLARAFCDMYFKLHEGEIESESDEG